MPTNMDGLHALQYWPIYEPTEYLKYLRIL